MQIPTWYINAPGSETDVMKSAQDAADISGTDQLVVWAYLPSDRREWVYPNPVRYRAYHQPATVVYDLEAE